MTVECGLPTPIGTISSLASALERLEGAVAGGMPRDLDLREWLDHESELLAALAAARPASPAELLLKAAVALRRLLQAVDQDASDDAALGRAALDDLQRAASAEAAPPAEWPRAA